MSDRNLQNLQHIHQLILHQPLSATGYDSLSTLLVEFGKLDAARRALRQTIILDSFCLENAERSAVRRNDLHLLHGDANFQNENWLNAIFHYQQFLSDNPSNTATQRKLAEALQYHAENNLRLAQTYYQDLEVQEPSLNKQNPKYQKLVAQMYWEHNKSQWQYTSLLLSYLLIKILNPSDQAHSNLLFVLKRITSEIPSEVMLEGIPVDKVLKLGHDRFREGDFEGAVSAYRSVAITLTTMIDKGDLQTPLEILKNFIDVITYHAGSHLSLLLAALAGAITYQETGEVCDFAHQAKIGLHCQTNAYFNDFVSWLVTKLSPSRVLNKKTLTGVLGTLTLSDLDRIQKNITNTSYHIFDEKLSSEICKKLISFALTTEGQLITQGKSEVRMGLHNRHFPQADGCYFQAQDIIDNHEIQKLIIDSSLIAVAREHLQAEPIFANVSMWWSSAYSQQPNSTMAQLYHFDMDWVKWTNFFFYLTPVDTYRGPHCYIAATHHRNSKPSHLLQRGYARISDSELRNYYPEERFVEILGDSGTIIVGDTRCYHKAKAPSKGDRLIINLTYANTLALGGIYEKPILKSKHHPDFLTASLKNSHLFAKFGNVNHPPA